MGICWSVFVLTWGFVGPTDFIFITNRSMFKGCNMTMYSLYSYSYLSSSILVIRGVVVTPRRLLVTGPGYPLLSLLHGQFFSPNDPNKQPIAPARTRFGVCLIHGTTAVSLLHNP